MLVQSPFTIRHMRSQPGTYALIRHPSMCSTYVCRDRAARQRSLERGFYVTLVALQGLEAFALASRITGTPPSGRTGMSTTSGLTRKSSALGCATIPSAASISGPRCCRKQREPRNPCCGLDLGLRLPVPPLLSSSSTFAPALPLRLARPMTCRIRW